MKLASLKQRFLALTIDFIVFCIVFFPVTRIVKGVWLMSVSDHRWNNGLMVFDPICLIFLIIIFLYFIILEALTGQTIGKAIMKIRVVANDFKRPGFKKSLIRNFGRLIDGIPLNLTGVYFILKTKENQRLGDIWAKTIVIIRS